MARQLDPKIGEVFKKHGLGAEACWDCHGTWVAYHWALERIAAQAGITFSLPMVLEANGVAKSVALAVDGHLADESQWSVGEAAPGNNKNAYPYAMAEKRAKDRVILKLIGLSGQVYSEEESDTFTPPKNMIIGKLNKTALEKKLREFAHELPNVSDENELAGLMDAYKDELAQCQQEHPVWWLGKGDGDAPGLNVRIEAMKDTLRNNLENPLSAG